MPSDPNAPRSRRALLTAAAGAAGAVAASAALPLTVAAAPANMQTESDNATIDTTSVTQSAAGHVAFKARTTNTDRAGVVGSTGDEAETQESLTSFTGVYGFAQADEVNGIGSGVWGDSLDTGVVGTGSVGVYGLGGIGVWGDGGGAPGVIGDSDTSTVPAILARASSSTGLALQVSGKVKFSRSGRSSIGTGKSSVVISAPGTTTSSRVFAVLNSNKTGRYVRAAVPGTNTITVYLNTTLTSAAFVAWFALD
jgi:hypothetical protein